MSLAKPTILLLLPIIVYLSISVVSATPDKTPAPNSFTGGSTGVKSDGSEKIFNVLDFGAKADGKTDNAKSFEKAWRAACDSGVKARMVMPKGEFMAGEMVFNGTCKAPLVVVEFAGTLKAKPDPKSYTRDTWMYFLTVHGLLITGGGVIDGQGPLVWKSKGKEGLPASIKVMDAKDIEINDIKSLNSMGCHLSVVFCENVRIANVKIEAPDQSPNTDGIHISQTSKFDIVDSHIGTGDDCVGIIRGCTDINIHNVVCGPGHGLSIGSLGKGDKETPVSGISVTNCTLKDTDNGVRIKTWAASNPGSCSDVIFKDIIMENVSNPIVIDQLYGGKSKEPSKVKITDVKFIDIRGTSRSEYGVTLNCSEEVPCQGIEMSNIDLKFNKGKPIKSTCSNVKVKYSGTQSPAAC